MLCSRTLQLCLKYVIIICDEFWVSFHFTREIKKQAISLLWLGSSQKNQCKALPYRHMLVLCWHQGQGVVHVLQKYERFCSDLYGLCLMLCGFHNTRVESVGQKEWLLVTLHHHRNMSLCEWVILTLPSIFVVKSILVVEAAFVDD